ncbi:hypothetical protein MNBD_PLANCTO02-2938 [hydrothermal vent metagenome]|uniref:Protein kinase domain-containing protein n=1 Tax=hydrothermal vent metagenome TaxID=652676 RepID=A0A3B1DJR5_9ZZZZ
MGKRKMGPFEVGKKLGVGGMGIVYLATYVKTGQQCALKVLSPALSSDKQLTARFSREMEILKRLQHEHIVRYFGGGKYKTQHYYAMELMDGGSVEDLLKEKKRFSWEQAIDIGIQVAKALEHAHNAGIVHRDLKPANLFLSVDGHMKLGDFGIARDTEATALTAAGKTVGTYAYMAPEQIAGKPPVSRKTDLYALGIVIYEMLAGHPPFEAESPAEMLFSHLNSDPPRVTSEAMDCPVWLEKVVDKLLEKDPEDRYFDALAVQVALKEVGEKVAKQQSLIQQTMADGRSGVTADETKSIRRALGKKRRKKKKQIPLHERSWFLASCLGLLLVLVTYALWPLSEEGYHEKWQKLMASEESLDWSEAKENFLVPYLEKYGENGKYAKEAEEHLEKIEMSLAERRAKNRAKKGISPQSEAERLYMEAYQFEKFGDRVSARDRYQKMVTLLKNRKKDFENNRPYINLARRQIATIDAAGTDVRERMEIILSTLKKADELDAQGKKLEATKLWDSIITLYSSNKEFEKHVLYAQNRQSGRSVEPFDFGNSHDNKQE